VETALVGGRLESFVVAAVPSLMLGCTAVLYPGPERPDAETAVVSAGDTTIDRVDGRWVRSGRIARYRLLPGLHTIEVNLESSYFDPSYVINWTLRPVALCFFAKAGRSYRTHPIMEARSWHPTIIDEQDERAVEVSCAEYDR